MSMLILNITIEVIECMTWKMSWVSELGTMGDANTDMREAYITLVKRLINTSSS